MGSAFEIARSALRTEAGRKSSMFKTLAASFSPKNLALLTFLTLIYFVAEKLGLKLAFVHPFLSPIWLPSGLALAAALLYGYRVWPAIFVGAFLSHVATSVPSFLIPVGVTLEGLAGAYLVNKFAHGVKAFDTAKGVFLFVFLGCICAPLISPTIGIGEFYLVGHSPSNLGVVWLTWWIAHGIGILLVTPFLVLLLRSSPQRWNPFELGELAVLLLGLIFVCLVVFGPLSLSLNMQKLVTAWLCFPFLIWAAFRFRPIEATGATLILFGCATWGTVQGYGTFADKSLTKSLLLLDPFIAVVGTMTLVVAAMVAERKSAEQELLTAQRLLQTAVEEKERDLVVTVKALEMEADGHVQTRTALHIIQEKLRRIPPKKKIEKKN